MNMQKLSKKKAFRENDKKVFADPCFVAETFETRVVGLMGEKSLAPGTGLLIAPCNSIHTFFMRFDIDVVFMDRGGKVVAVKRNIKPWRMTLPVFGAHSVLEMPAGSAANLKEGEILCLN